MESKTYDCIIVGGGLAGLSLSILLAKKKYNVLLLEKKLYPYHKVCGEYISMESWNFLVRLGIPIDKMNLPRISKLKMTSTSGNYLTQALDLGGFGISRYTLDNLLVIRARQCGVTILEKTNCNHHKKCSSGLYEVHTNQSIFQAKIVCASFGRHAFGNFYKPLRLSENWIGVKYHIQGDFSAEMIELHTFKHGYCGISKIDQDQYCLCYLAKASLLKTYDNSLAKMESEVLFQNPFLKQIFEKATFIYEKPLSISNISFSENKAVHDGIFYLGDASGSIAPLTGNGMSNAMRSAWILSKSLDSFLQNIISFDKLSKNYQRDWSKAFQSRLRLGRFIQYFFCMPILTPIFIFVMSLSKNLRKSVVKQTHGNTF